MGDSDDEFERRRRDKFRGERSDYSGGGGGGGGRDRRDDGRRSGRDEWGDRSRDGWGGRERGSSRREYGREYGGGRTRDRYSPSRHDLSPPVKRVRQDWDDRRYGGYEGGGGTAPPSYGAYPSSYSQEYTHPPGHGAAAGRLDELGPTQPPMMTFKAFMEQCDDTITEEEALRKYSDYKLEFKRQQLNEFFINHKEEEWFKAKYHPEECVKRKEEQLANLKRRMSTFSELYHAGRLETISVDADQSDQLLKLLDSVVIKLEGGTDLDLQVLDQVVEEEPPKPPQATPGTLDAGGDGEGTGGGQEEEGKLFVLGEDSDEGGDNEATGEGEKDPDAPLKMDMSEEQKELQKKAKEYLKQKGSDGAGGGEEGVTTGEEHKRKRSDFSSSSSSSSSSSDSGDEGLEGDFSEPPPPGMEGGGLDGEKKEEEEEEKKEEEEEGEEGEEQEEGKKENGIEDAAKENGEPMEEDGAAKEETEEGKEDKEKEKEKEDGGGGGGGEKEGEGEEEDVEMKPRALHKTASIFLRNLAPTITKQEVEAMCRRYNGFLRAAIADPQPERRWFRRGWVTFKRHVNIKDICWNLNNIRLRDCELGAIVNRDLSRRIRTVNGITSHRSVVRADIKLSAKIIQNLDSRWGLWAEEAAAILENPLLSLTSSSNPVLRNITDYLIEEASAEEEELLGGNSGGGGGGSEEKGEGEAIEREPSLIKVLDRLLLYLRIVHSVDYYNHSEYPNEDEMPNRCGIMHARGIPPSSKVTPQEVQDYCRAFENKIGSFLQPLTRLTDDEAKKLGLKEAEEEVEKFVQSNTQEVAKDKWQCPLCGKKFKGAEYVHKHILMKHAEKVKEVKKEVDYFNNYLRDPKRPQLPEYPGNKHGGRKEDRPDPYVATYPQHVPDNRYAGYGGGYGRQYPAHSYGGYSGTYPKDYYGRGDPYTREPYPRPRVTYRSRVGYRDLDAPKEDY
ncbi:serrate RNA effector molecule homolog isoform X2 [Portunus trituberculatus]|uniref:serrate RNA effector molecule homolog isoform X2 n=1 Tax=Portunus trituberculatus TaxID=210409 RepID=UPI001E1D183C|nr:serrate RNA effector molecule homolog isoform X2 [Portunus trituberculatus]